jgi:hypothetical protein
MSFMMAMQAIGTGISVYSAMQEGNAANDMGKFKEQQYQQEQINSMIESEQMHVDRINQFDSATATNEAFRSFLGRDTSDSSFQAFLDKQKETAFRDASRISFQGFMKSESLELSGKVARYEGAVQAKSARNKAMMSLVGGMGKMYETMAIA